MRSDKCQSEEGHVHIIGIALVIIGLIALASYLGTMGEQIAAGRNTSSTPPVDQAALAEVVEENHALKQRVGELEQKLAGEQAYCDMLRRHDAKVRIRQPGKPGQDPGLIQTGAGSGE